VGNTWKKETSQEKRRKKSSLSLLLTQHFLVDMSLILSCEEKASSFSEKQKP